MIREKLGALKTWLAFGLTAEQEDRFRQASLDSDLAQARIGSLVIIIPLVGFVLNDYWLFGPSWNLAALAAVRLVLVAHTAWLLRFLSRSPNYRAYDGAEFMWGLVVVLSIAMINVSRPDAYTGHLIVSVVMIFLFLVAIPNRFPAQVALSVAMTMSEVLVVISHLHTPTPASLATLGSLLVANVAGIAVSRLLHAARRREFLAREQEQVAHRQAEEQATLLETILTSIADGVLALDAEGRITRMNPAAAEFLGFLGVEADRPLSERITSLQPLADDGQPLSWAESAAARALHGEKVQGLIMGVHLPGPAGAPPRWTSASATPIYDVAGRLVSAVTTITDITALRQARDELDLRVRERTAELVEVNQALQAEIAVRRQTEEDLRESEQRFRQLAENIDDVFWLLEPATGRFLYMSPVGQSLWGPCAEGTDDSWDRLLARVYPDDRERLLAWQAPADRFDQEFRIVRPGGELRWVRGRAFPIQDNQGQVGRVAGIIEDITVQKAVQTTLIQAEQATATSRLAASLAHEINSPLQAAIGCLDLTCEALTRGQDPERYLQVIHTSLDEAARVVAQLRALHRDSQREEWQLVDLRDIVDEVLLLTSQECEARGVSVVQAPGPKVLPIRLMPNAIKHVFISLVHNALDAMPQGGELEIGVEWAFKPDGLWIRFADTGDGLAPEIGPHLFEPFHSTKAEGLGLGLFICQRIVQQHGGCIEHASRPGGGTVFSVFIPSNV